MLETCKKSLSRPIRLFLLLFTYATAPVRPSPVTDIFFQHVKGSCSASSFRLVSPECLTWDAAPLSEQPGPFASGPGDRLLFRVVTSRLVARPCHGSESDSRCGGRPDGCASSLPPISRDREQGIPPSPDWPRRCLLACRNQSSYASPRLVVPGHPALFLWEPLYCIFISASTYLCLLITVDWVSFSLGSSLNKVC